MKRAGAKTTYSSAEVHRLAAIIAGVAGALAASGASDAAMARDALHTLEAFQAACAALSGYSAKVTAFERKGDEAEVVVFDYTFHRPSLVSIQVLRGATAGVRLAWSGGPTVTARRGAGPIGLFRRSLPLRDPSLLSPRGSSIDELSFGRILAHALQTPGTIVEGPRGSVNGIPTVSLVFTPANPAADRGYTRETVDLSAAGHLPVRISGYEGSTVVRQIDFGDLKLER
jgi:hypothetical protein